MASHDHAFRVLLLANITMVMVFVEWATGMVNRKKADPKLEMSIKPLAIKFRQYNKWRGWVMMGPGTAHCWPCHMVGWLDYTDRPTVVKRYQHQRKVRNCSFIVTGHFIQLYCSFSPDFMALLQRGRQFYLWSWSLGICVYGRILMVYLD